MMFEFIYIMIVFIWIFDVKKQKKNVSSYNIVKSPFVAVQLFVLIAIFAGFWGAYVSSESKLRLFDLDLIHGYAGSFISVLSMLIFLRSKRELGGNFSPCYAQETAKSITTTGIYKYIRHPIYTSNMGVCIGLFVMTANLLLLLSSILLAVSYAIFAIKEENDLSHKFDAYKNYMATTGRFLPRVDQLLRGLKF